MTCPLVTFTTSRCFSCCTVPGVCIRQEQRSQVGLPVAANSDGDFRTPKVHIIVDIPDAGMPVGWSYVRSQLPEGLFENFLFLFDLYLRSAKRILNPFRAAFPTSLPDAMIKDTGLVLLAEFLSYVFSYKKGSQHGSR